MFFFQKNNQKMLNTKIVNKFFDNAKLQLFTFVP